MKNKLDRELEVETVVVDENGKSLRDHLEHKVFCYVGAWADKHINEEEIRAQLLADAAKGTTSVAIPTGEFKFIGAHAEAVARLMYGIFGVSVTGVHGSTSKNIVVWFDWRDEF